MTNVITIDTVPSPKLVDFGERGAVLDTTPNIKAIADYLGFGFRLNLITHDIDVSFKGKPCDDMNSQANFHTEIHDECNRRGLRVSSARLAEMLRKIASDNAVNPVKDYLDSLQWDGTSRFRDLAEVLNPKEIDAAETYIKRALIYATKAGSYETGPIPKSEGLVVLQGQQGARKTTFIKALFAGVAGVSKDGISINLNCKDSIRQAVSAWGVEIGEIETTQRKNQASAMKAFLSQTVDEIRLPYAIHSTKMVRRASFWASVNSDDFLNDSTGNRRFWTVACQGVIDIESMPDMNQVLAEAYALAKQGEPHWLLPDELERLEHQNKAFTAPSSAADAILAAYDFNVDKRLWQRVPRAEVSDRIGLPVNTAGGRQLTDAARLLELEEVRGASGRFIVLPPCKPFGS